MHNRRLGYPTAPHHWPVQSAVSGAHPPIPREIKCASLRPSPLSHAALPRKQIRPRGDNTAPRRPFSLHRRGYVFDTSSTFFYADRDEYGAVAARSLGWGSGSASGDVEAAGVG